MSYVEEGYPVAFLKSIRLYLIVGLLSFLFFIVFLMPANVVWKMVKKRPEIIQQEIVLNNIHGSIWAGEAQVYVKSNALGTLKWDINFLSLFLAKFSVDIDLKQKNYFFNGVLAKGVSGLSVEIFRGEVDAEYLNEHLAQYKIKLSNKIKVKQISVSFDQKNGFTDAQGDVLWLGGGIEYFANNRMNKVAMPKLKLALSTNAKQLVVKMTNESKQALAEILVKPDGWATVDVKKRLAELAGQKIPGSASADDMIFNIEKKIF